jgi:flagellar basal-body rod modification protein FlgD
MSATTSAISALTSGTSSSTSKTSSTGSSSSSSTTVDMNTFLTLLIAQLENQDPLNPDDPSQFTSELAQYSSLEQLTNINSSLDGLSTISSLQSQTMASDSIGKVATISGGSSIAVSGGTTTSLGFKLSSASSATTVTIYNSNGNEVNSYSLGALSSGTHAVSWNGLDSSGNAVDDGDYSFKVSATDSAGGSVATTTECTGVVSGVDYSSSGSILLAVNGQEYDMADVTSLSSAS